MMNNDKYQSIVHIRGAALKCFSCFIGSVVGSSIAYFLKESQNKLNVMVVEQDTAYSQASALLSAGGWCRDYYSQSICDSVIRNPRIFLALKNLCLKDVSNLLKFCFCNI